MVLLPSPCPLTVMPRAIALIASRRIVGSLSVPLPMKSTPLLKMLPPIPQQSICFTVDAGGAALAAPSGAAGDVVVRTTDCHHFGDHGCVSACGHDKHNGYSRCRRLPYHGPVAASFRPPILSSPSIVRCSLSTNMCRSSPAGVLSPEAGVNMVRLMWAVGH